MLDKKNNFHVMLKPVCSICNLDCEYCYYKYKNYLYPNEKMNMSLKLLKKFTIHYLRSRDSGEVVFGWQGGEPTLLGVDFFKKAISFQKKYAKKGVKILNTLQTNGTLLNDEWGKFLVDNNFLVGISIDGPPNYHDIYRKDKKGNPSSKLALKGLHILKKWNVEFNILACVHKGNQDHPIEIYKYFKESLGAKFIQFIPIVERKRVKTPSKNNNNNDDKNLKINNRNYDFHRTEELYDYSIEPLKYGQFLYKIFKEWVKNDVGEIFIQIFDTTLSSYLSGPPGLCCFAQTCGDALVMEYNGDLYSCDHFVEPEFYLGNISNTSLMDLVLFEKQKKFGLSKKTSLPEKCLNCEVKHICNGGCLRNRIINTENSKKKLNYLCEGYKYFFIKTAPYMEIMAQLLQKRQPASEIMNILKRNPIK